jgi:enoyl-CoA hydratase/carnithine racemase
LVPGLQVDEHGHAKILRFHNPDRANALDDAILQALVRELEDTRPGQRVVVLSGSGPRHFSSGLDLGGAEGTALAARIRDGERSLEMALAAIAGCRVPVVAMVNGSAFGGALELAVACDWRVAVRDARLGMPAARLGVIYAPAGLARFVAIMGPARARQLFLTGRPVTADRALAIGLVDEVIDPAAIAETIRELCADIAATAPGAVAGTRRAISLLEEPVAPEVAAEIERLRTGAYASPEFTEALTAFRERRTAHWDPDPAAD